MQIRKLPLERRRRSETDELAYAPFPPLRRESDLSRVRIQHWIELAEIALGKTHNPKIAFRSRQK
jgi:hypothetical protein